MVCIRRLSTVFVSSHNFAFQYFQKEEDTPPLSEVAVEKSASATCLSQSAWKVADIPSPPPLSSLVSIEASASSSKKRLQGRFTPKGAKFRDASNLLSEEQEQGTHFAPW